MAALGEGVSKVAPGLAGAIVGAALIDAPILRIRESKWVFPDGALLTQVQAMPGYTNRLIYRFDRTGTYTVRCLEYCGIFHHFMLTKFIVR